MIEGGRVGGFFFHPFLIFIFFHPRNQEDPAKMVCERVFPGEETETASEGEGGAFIERFFAGMALGDSEADIAPVCHFGQRTSRPLLVGDPEGRVRLVQSAAITVDELKDELEVLCGVPAEEQMLSCPACGLGGLQGKEAGKEDVESARALALPDYAMVYVRLRCLGGKGGFGAMLRGQASRPGMKKAESNTGAMRDLSGRRLRHVEQEAQLKDWVKEEGKRKQDKEAEKKEKRVKHHQEIHATAEAYVAEAAVDQEAIADAVRQGIDEEKRRKKEEENAKERTAATTAKNVKKLDKLFGDDSSDQDNDSSENEEDKEVKEKK
jgi:hypothetical protein